MRRSHVLVVVLTLLLLGTTWSPVSADSAGLAFTRTPVGGPSGTRISITGRCNTTTGRAQLSYRARSDALRPPGDDATFAVAEDGTFSTELVNPFDGARVSDAEVAVSCGRTWGAMPFAVTNNTTTASPTIFTALGEGACGQNFGPVGSDTRIPCPAHVKGLTGGGALAGTNFYVEDWLWGASVAVGDVDGDHVLDIVAGSGPNRPSGYAVLNARGQTKTNDPYVYLGFEGGVRVATGDIDGDGIDEIVTGAGPGGGPHVKIYMRNVQYGFFAEVASFYAYAPEFDGGVNVAAGDFTGDGKAEIITGAGAGGGPHVRVFSGDGTPVESFYAYAPAFAGGVSVAAGDLDDDGRAEIVTGAGPGGGPHVRVFREPIHTVRGGFYAYAPEFGGGVWVGVGDADASPGRHIVTSPGEGGDPHIRLFDENGGSPNGGFYAYDNFRAGTRVAVAP